MNPCVHGHYALVGGAPRHTVVVVCVCEWVSLWVIPRDSCSHFLRDRCKLRPETCNASLTQYYLEMKLVNFGLIALLSSYGMICSPRRLLPAIQSPAKNKSLTAGCLSTWQFNLYNKSDGDLSETRRTRLPKLHSLSFAYLSIRGGRTTSRAHNCRAVAVNALLFGTDLSYQK